MKKERILVVEEDPQLQRLLRAQLLAREFDVQVADRGEDALLTTAEFEPDMILLALALPGINGVETCQRLREWTHIPIIVLNDQARGEAPDTIAEEALDAGADDYVTRPYRMAELLARMRAVLRRARDWAITQSPATPLTFGNLTLDLVNRRVLLNNQPLHLTPTEYELLHVLASHAGRILTHRELLKRVWGAESADNTQYLHVFVGQLRRKLELRSNAACHILTEPGVGYQFAADA